MRGSVVAFLNTSRFGRLLEVQGEYIDQAQLCI